MKSSSAWIPSATQFSPGFVIDGTPHSKPRIFISHGTNDSILPIDRCGRRIASRLRARGYDVTFREFDGDHEIPADIVREGLRFPNRTERGSAGSISDKKLRRGD